MPADGHWWPESYYLGTLQARETLLKVCCSQQSPYSSLMIL